MRLYCRKFWLWVLAVPPIAGMVARRICVEQHSFHDRAIRREFADGIGVRGVAGQQCRLATATAEIDFPLRTTLARFRHPFRSTESVEAFRFSPNPIEIACSDIFKTQIGN